MSKKKLSYDIDPQQANITVRKPLPEGGEAVMTLELDASLRDVSRRLALMGLTVHLQRACTRDKGDSDPFDVLEEAYKELQEQGLAAFERRSPVQRAPRGPTKAQKIAALAAMYNTTVEVIRGKLKDKTDEDVNIILNNEKVLAKVNELKAAEDISL